MKTIEDMVRLNQQQAKFYNAVAKVGTYEKSKKISLVTRFWAHLRNRQQAALKLAGVDDTVKQAHIRWINSKAGGDFLELGCFSGSLSTFSLVEAANTYLGVELSSLAVESLNKKFAERGLAHKAVAEAVDFLTLKEDRKFDLIYAHGVLHHFENPEPLFKKLAALAKPKASLIFCEPSAVNPFYRALRSVYRPFQSDAPWEWPFTRKTVMTLESYYELVEGFGWGSWSLPLSVLTGLPMAGGVMRPIYLRTVQAEVKKGWYNGIWNNSYVTAHYRLRQPKNYSGWKINKNE